MPTTRYGLSCHTQEDKQLIEWLDSFPTPRKRNEVIKQILLDRINGVEPKQSVSSNRINDEQFEQLQNGIEKIYRKVVMMKYSEQEEPETDSGELTEEQIEQAEKNLVSGLDF